MVGYFRLRLKLDRLGGADHIDYPFIRCKGKLKSSRPEKISKIPAIWYVWKRSSRKNTASRAVNSGSRFI